MPRVVAGGAPTQPPVNDIVNVLTATTVDGTLEDMAGLDTVARAAVERNLSELAATVNLLLARLRAANIIEG